MSESTCVLSIIVPVYNVEKYLGDCLDSLLLQDLSTDEYEIICVDDGSKDSSPKILDEYAEKHVNIRVIHKQNGGVSSARNVGIEAAKGDYLWFVDSDDCIMPNCLGQLCQIAKEHHPQLIRFGWEEIDDKYTFKNEVSVKDILEYSIQDKLLPNMVSAAWQVIIQRTLVEKHAIRFHQEMKYGEDTLFVFEVCMHLTFRWVIVNRQIYRYRKAITSVTRIQTQESIDQRYQDRLRSIQVISSYRNQDYPNKNLLNRYAYLVKYKALHYFPKTTYDFDQGIEELREAGVFPLKFSWDFICTQKTLKERLGVLRNSIMFRLLLLYKGFYKRQRKQK